MKFAHFADCHLGGWRHPELKALNIESFKKALSICIKEKADFVLISGDLFDSAYPSIDVLEETFFQLRELKNHNIPCYIIAGSHDYSASGKTFLSVLEKAGFCINLYKPEEIKGEIYLNPTIHRDVALYGYPGKKSGMEVQELRKIKLQECPGLFSIFALHTSIKDAVGNLPIDSVDEKELPEADYYALGHLHIEYERDKFIYAGPIFPNNFQELEELNYGSFYMIETSPFTIKRIEIKLRNVEVLELEVSNALSATDKIIKELGKRDLREKIVLLKIFGKLSQGKTSDINFAEIENFSRSREAYSFLKSTSKLLSEQPEINLEIEDAAKLEEEIIKKFLEQSKSKFDSLIFPLTSALSLEKHEEEKSSAFNTRLFSELSKIINLELK